MVDMSYCVNGFRADSCHYQAPFVLVALFMVLVFMYFSQKFPTFMVRCGLALIGVVQPTAHLSWICVMLQVRMNKFS